MDQLLHTGEHFGFLRSEDLLCILSIVAAFWELIDTLTDNAHALANLFSTHEVTVVAVTSCADGHFKIELLITKVRLVLAQIETKAAGSKIRSRQTVSDGVLFRDRTDTDSAIHKDTVTRQQFVDLIKHRQHALTKLKHTTEPAVWDVTRDTTNACVTGSETSTGQFLEKCVEFFTLGESIHKDCPCARIHSVNADAK